jgi:hypothetical protein
MLPLNARLISSFGLPAARKPTTGNGIALAGNPKSAMSISRCVRLQKTVFPLSRINRHRRPVNCSRKERSEQVRLSLPPGRRALLAGHLVILNGLSGPYGSVNPVLARVEGITGL